MDAFPADALWFRLMSGLLVGLVLGSFITMLSYRIPRGISIITPPSHCPHCRSPLKPIDLVPVLSWLFEGGKCRYCRSPISPRYLLIELATTASVLMAFIVFGFTPALAFALIGIVALVTLVTINLERNK